MEGGSVERVEHWRKKAYDFSSSDRLGFVLSRAMDLMGIVVKDGTAAKNLQFAARSLEMERRMAMEDDDERSAPLREMVYGLCETLGITIKSILDERSQPLQQLPQAPTGNEMVKEDSKEESSYAAAAVELPLDSQLDYPSAPQTSSMVMAKEEEEAEMSGMAYDEDGLVKDEIEEPEESISLSHRTNALVDYAKNFLVPTPVSIFRQTQFDPTANPATRRMENPARIDSPADRPQIECDECGKKFTTKKSMETHKVVHKGQRNHVCSLCGWEFMRRSDLLRHLKNVDHSKPVKCAKDRRKFECDFCGTPFYRLADKSNHVKTMHGDMYTM